MKMTDSEEKRTDACIASQALYKTLGSSVYERYPYERRELGEGMALISLVMCGYWKPRYLVDDRNGTAVEFMNGDTVLQTITADDIDWDSMKRVPESALERARNLDAWFPTFVGSFKDGVANVSWQINPDGQYYMDDDGFGMTDDEEISLCGKIDRNGRAVGKFRVG